MFSQTEYTSEAFSFFLDRVMLSCTTWGQEEKTITSGDVDLEASASNTGEASKVHTRWRWACTRPRSKLRVGFRSVSIRCSSL